MRGQNGYNRMDNIRGYLRWSNSRIHILIMENLPKMKLSEYIHKKMGPPHAITWRARTEEQIEEWIVEWYRSEFNEVGCDGSVAQSRMPPSWLTVWRRDEEA